MGAGYSEPESLVVLTSDALSWSIFSSIFVSIAVSSLSIASRCSRKRLIVSRFMVVRQRSSCAASSWWSLMYSVIFSASGAIFCAKVSSFCVGEDLLLEGFPLVLPLPILQGLLLQLPILHGGGVWFIGCLLLLCHLNAAAVLALASSALAVAPSALLALTATASALALTTAALGLATTAHALASVASAAASAAAIALTASSSCRRCI